MWLTMGGMLFAQLVHVTVGEGVFILLCLCLVLYKRGDDTIMAREITVFLYHSHRYANCSLLVKIISGFIRCLPREEGNC